MAIKITSNVSTTNDYVTINYTADKDLTKIELTKDGTNFITASSFNQTSATFHIPDWSNGTYSNCYLRGTYENKTPEQSPEQSSLLDSNGAYLLDDFTGTSLDRSKWDYEWGYVRNGELQNYQDSNAVVNNGILELQGRKNNGTWTSASIISKGHFAFMYGKIECRAKIDPTWGSFSAFWTLGDSFEFGYHNWASPDTLGEWWAWCGEFDVMEFYSGRLTCGTFFNDREESGRVWYDNYDFNAWHTFAMEWLENGTLIFSIDGHELSRTNPTDNRAFHIPHFILINQAIGASGGTPADSTTAITQYVDWVKYYPPSTNNVVLNSSDFYLTAMDFNDNNCMVRPTFNDNCINKSLTWSSSNSSIVEVHSGLCVAKGNGTATITATSHSGASRNITITVSNGTITGASGGSGGSNNTYNITQTSVVGDIKSSNAYAQYGWFFDNSDYSIIIPGLTSTMVPQGMCKNGNYIYVSAYDYNGVKSSCIYVINAFTHNLEKTLWLKDSRNHVGGVASNGSYLYITCGTRIGVVSLFTINSASNNSEITLTYLSIKTDTGSSVRCSTCTYDSSRNLLWVGQFNETQGDYAYAYTVNGASSLTYKCKIDVPQYTQGLCFDGNTVYFCASYGRNNDSLLYKCTWGGENNHYWYSPQDIIGIPPTGEGIFRENGRTYILFENGASHYRNSSNPSKYPMDRICGYKI